MIYKYLTIIFVLIFYPQISLSGKYSKVYKKTPITIQKGFPIKCSGTRYTHTGFYSNSIGIARLKAKTPDKYVVEILRSKNSSPLEANILLKNDSVLMVDNEEFRIINNNKDELTAVFVNNRNVIVVVLNASLGAMHL